MTAPTATLIAARILGPLLLAAGVAFILQRARMLGAVDAFIEDDTLAVFAGFISLALGLTLTALHDRWSGFTQIVISLIGWIAVVRGVLLLFAPAIAQQAAAHFVTQPAIAPIVGCVLALLGVWLAYVGFVGRPQEEDR